MKILRIKGYDYPRIIQAAVGLATTEYKFLPRSLKKSLDEWINYISLHTGMDIMTCRKDIINQIEDLNK